MTPLPRHSSTGSSASEVSRTIDGMAKAENNLRPLVLVGGQALIEGVLMKSPSKVCTAARTAKGIITKTWEHISITQRIKLLGWPVLRGAVILFEMIVIGTKALAWSADQQDETNTQMGTWPLLITILLSVAFAVGLFVAAPYFLTAVFVPKQGFAFNLLDGAWRLLIFILYVAVIGLIPDIRVTFQYHGAEHKAVHCHEAGLPLTPQNAQKFSTVHPRCGTSLMVFVIALSIVLFSVIRFDHWYLNIPLRVLIVPLIAGISYEVLRVSASHTKNVIARVIMAPGLWVQKMTTREPTDGQVEIALAALKGVL